MAGPGVPGASSARRRSPARLTVCVLPTGTLSGFGRLPTALLLALLVAVREKPGGLKPTGIEAEEAVRAPRGCSRGARRWAAHGEGHLIEGQ